MPTLVAAPGRGETMTTPLVGLVPVPPYSTGATAGVLRAVISAQETGRLHPLTIVSAAGGPWLLRRDVLPPAAPALREHLEALGKVFAPAYLCKLPERLRRALIEEDESLYAALQILRGSLSGPAWDDLLEAACAMEDLRGDGYDWSTAPDLVRADDHLAERIQETAQYLSTLPGLTGREAIIRAAAAFVAVLMYGGRSKLGNAIRAALPGRELSNELHQLAVGSIPLPPARSSVASRTISLPKPLTPARPSGPTPIGVPDRPVSVREAMSRWASRLPPAQMWVLGEGSPRSERRPPALILRDVSDPLFVVPIEADPRLLDDLMIDLPTVEERFRKLHPQLQTRTPDGWISVAALVEASPGPNVRLSTRTIVLAANARPPKTNKEGLQ